MSPVVCEACLRRVLEPQSVLETRTAVPTFEQPIRQEVFPTGDASPSGLLLTIEEGASLLNIGRTLMYQLIAKGEVPAVRLGRRRLILRSDLERFVTQLHA